MFCRPLLVARALRNAFAFDGGIHAEPHRRARQARAAFLAGESVPEAATLLLTRHNNPAANIDALLAKTKADASGPRVLGPAEPVTRDEPIAIDPELEAVLEKRLVRLGDVTTILEQAASFDVFRLLATTEEAWKVEAVRCPKVDFEGWFETVRLHR